MENRLPLLVNDGFTLYFGVSRGDPDHDSKNKNEKESTHGQILQICQMPNLPVIAWTLSFTEVAMMMP